MKRILALSLALLILLVGCSSTPSPQETTTPAPSDGGDTSHSPTPTEEVPTPPDLTGEWKQVDGNSEDTYQTATIKDGVIEVYWINETENSKALYWAGTYIAPTTADEPFSWDSANDTEKTSTAILASGDDTKTFTYQNGQISYEVSALGVTQTVKLEKSEA